MLLESRRTTQKTENLNLSLSEIIIYRVQITYRDKLYLLAIVVTGPLLALTAVCCTTGNTCRKACTFLPGYPISHLEKEQVSQH